MENITIYCKNRNRALERDVAYVSKVDFGLRSFSETKLAKVISAHFPGNGEMLLNNDCMKILREIPAFNTFPIDKKAFTCTNSLTYDIVDVNTLGTSYLQELPPPQSVNYPFMRSESEIQPEILTLDSIRSGQKIESRKISCSRYAMLATVFETVTHFFPQTFDDLIKFARQIGPGMDLTDSWDDKAVVAPENLWKEAKIEYEQFHYYSNGKNRFIQCILDDRWLIQHLFLEKLESDGSCIIIPQTFATHSSFKFPLLCNFPFSPEWWLLGSEKLSQNQSAEVWITNEEGVFKYNLSVKDSRRIFLAYLFGKEMIHYLKLDNLRFRNVKILILKRKDSESLHRNLEEALLLMSRLKKMEIRAEFQIAEENDSSQKIKNEIPDDCSLLKISFSQPVRASVEEIVKIASRHHIRIPENLDSDRFGILSNHSDTELVTDFIHEGCLTAITAHSGVDLSLISASIIAGAEDGFIFSWQRACKRQLKPCCFIQPSTETHHNRIMKNLSADNFTFCKIPEGPSKTVRETLKNLVKENGYNLFIFESRYSVKDNRDVLQTACEWAQQHRIGIVIITSEEDTSAGTFFADTCDYDFHFWRTGRRFQYIVENYPLLDGESSFFKITLADHKWHESEVSESEILEIEGRNLATPQSRMDDNIETAENNPPIGRP